MISNENLTVILGKFKERDMPDFSERDWSERAFTVGIGGLVNFIY